MRLIAAVISSLCLSNIALLLCSRTLMNCRDAGTVTRLRSEKFLETSAMVAELVKIHAFCSCPRRLPKHSCSCEGMDVVILSTIAKSHRTEKQFQWSSASNSEG
jgi:hypothetical protein